ncbi:MAG: hypothetical protein ACI4IN_06375 [Eubacterium sp.]
MDENKAVVLVLSRNYSTGLGVIRALGKAGYTVDLIASVKQRGSSVIASSSKYVRNCVEVLSPVIQEDDGSGLIDAVMAYADCGQQAVLFPTDDFTTTVAAANFDALSQYFVMPHTLGDVTVLEAMDKTYQCRLAKKCGMLTPRQWAVSLRQDIVIPEDIIFPCFVKPVQSAAGKKAEMRRCDSARELVLHLQDMQAFFSHRDVLIQEYLEIDREYDFSGVCVDGQVIIPAVLEKQNISLNERGVTMVGRMLPADTLGTAMDSIVSMLKELRFVGMFDFEVNLCGDKLYFGEINLRSGGPNYSYCLAGANLPAIAVQELTEGGHNPQWETVDEFGKTFVYEKVAWEDYIHSYISRSRMRHCINDSDYTLLADHSDPKPGKIFGRRIRLSAIKHRIYKLIGRE